MDKFFAVCSPGLERYTSRELTNLGVTVGRDQQSEDEENGGVEFSGTPETLYLANLHLRTASRILLRFGDFYAAAFSELRKKASRLPWERYLLPGERVTIRVTCRKSKLYHSSAVAERIAGAIADHLGMPPDIVTSSDSVNESPSQLIIVRLVHDQCTISIDSSGEHLHRRGYRLASAKAPLRETLAAGLLLAAGWQPSESLLDPFCGSGTIAIEAAMIQAKIPPGANRPFAFMKWPGYDPASWIKIQESEKARPVDHTSDFLASDRDAGAINMAQANAARAGVDAQIQFSCQAFSAIGPTEKPGWIITNPPYGVRVSENKDLRNLYDQIGNVLRNKFKGWKVGILCSDHILLSHTRLKLDESTRFINGGIPVIFGIGQV